MLEFNVAMLGNLADFLMMPPIIYFVGMILLCFVVGLFINFIRSCT